MGARPWSARAIKRSRSCQGRRSGRRAKNARRPIGIRLYHRPHKAKLSQVRLKDKRHMRYCNGAAEIRADQAAEGIVEALVIAWGVLIEGRLIVYRDDTYAARTADRVIYHSPGRLPVGHRRPWRVQRHAQQREPEDEPLGEGHVAP